LWKDEKALAFLRSFVIDEMFICIENVTNALNEWKTFNKIFDTQSESK